ncbi:hypothetical protein K461DRAFT_268950 [Myriangium duriaei CBS 260.36]|uniref:Tat pathway signal sequence n=1 Tax=Myriangium duriaei CBS 260.36 TaxID=1168546 RepID=A0A9P4MJ89_9PEZI|nr:hypothetical protein K461DRAFT_268950 [Myriangium duriaei CBS 260.36]
MKKASYTQVPQATSNDESQELHQPHLDCRSPAKRRSTTALQIAIFFASCSAIVNCVFLYQQHYRPWQLLHGLPSRYAQLPRNVPVEYVRSTDYGSLNRTIQDAAWNDPEVDPSVGFVALHDQLVMDLDLPRSQRWPWDSSKGVYGLQASHELHCLHTFRLAYNEYHDGVKKEDQSYTYGHVMHCLNILLQTVMCNADDTPLYFGRLHANVDTTNPRAGIGSIRMCRDWKALNAWSRSHSACYVFERDIGENRTEFDRYKFCPDGSQPWLKSKNSDGSDGKDLKERYMTTSSLKISN